MMTFIHVVGGQGVGKSMLILALAARYQARGLVCAGQDPQVFTSRAEALEAAPGAQVYFIEHQDDSTLDPLPGELVIRMEKVSCPAWDGVSHLKDFVVQAPAHQAQAAINSETEQGAAHG